MSEYRDYGQSYIPGIGNNKGKMNTNIEIPKRQVYTATHRGDGTRLPYMNRSFISFTYGGQAIEDFDLVATLSSDRMERDGYTPFNDQTTNYDNLDGQYYWGTHFTANTLTFQLSTDGIDQKKLEAFLNWFTPGVSRELILAEHPNRAQMARVSEPPQLSVLPFEYHTTMQISQQTYPVVTTLYKGDITLELVMDEPHWYGKTNILGIEKVKDGEHYFEDEFVDADGNVTSIFASADALKILYEDGIPLGTMIHNDMLLGNGAYARVENTTESQIWSIPEASIVITEGVPSGEGARIDGNIAHEDYTHNSLELMTDENYNDLTTEQGTELRFNKDPSFIPTRDEFPSGRYYGKIAGAIVDAEGNGIEILYHKDSGERYSAGYFYYAGNAPAPTKISFTLTPMIGNNYYIIVPHNKIGDQINNTTADESTYNSFIIESLNKQVLKFTTPNFYTSYNQAIYLFNHEIDSTLDWEGLYGYIRDRVRHPAVRAWAAKVLDSYKASTGDTVVISSLKENILNSMSYLLKDTNDAVMPVTFTFDSKTGEAIGSFSYRKPTNTIPNSEEFNNFGTIVTDQEEDVGDMLYSNYITIKDRNYPDEHGEIVQWRDDAIGHGFAHKVTHDVLTPLTHVQIEYKNIYL